MEKCIYVLDLLSNFRIHQKLDERQVCVDEKTLVQRRHRDTARREKLLLCKSMESLRKSRLKVEFAFASNLFRSNPLL